MKRRVISAVFDSSTEASQAVSDLRRAGVADSALSLIGQHDGRTETTAGDGTVTDHGDDGDGSVLRGILGGGALGAGLAVAALAIPGVGPLAAAGAIAASAVPGAIGVGAVLGAAAGTLGEVLGDHGVDEEDSRYYHDRITSGGTFVSVDADLAGVSSEEIERILYLHGGHNASRARGTGTTTTASTGY